MKMSILRKTKVMFLVMAVIASFMAVPVHAHSMFNGVVFYEHDNFTGKYSMFKDNIDIPNFGNQNVGDNAISSLLIDGGNFEVTVYDQVNYGGVSHKYRFSDASVSSELIGNDRISSAKIRKLTASEMEGVYIFEHANYSGKWVKLTSNVSDMTQTYVGNDRASSVRVVGNYKYQLWTDANFRGTSMMSSTASQDLSRSNVGNDSLSSVAVFRTNP